MKVTERIVYIIKRNCPKKNQLKEHKKQNTLIEILYMSIKMMAKK